MEYRGYLMIQKAEFIKTGSLYLLRVILDGKPVFQEFSQNESIEEFATHLIEIGAYLKSINAPAIKFMDEQEESV